VHGSRHQQPDTPAHLKEYLASFDRRIRGLTGAVEQIAAVAKAYRAYYKCIALEDGGHTKDHSDGDLFDGSRRKVCKSDSLQFPSCTGRPSITRVSQRLDASTQAAGRSSLYPCSLFTMPIGKCDQ
jgi:hypothetical protein